LLILNKGVRRGILIGESWVEVEVGVGPVVGLVVASAVA